ncbi:hypothetical protein E2C01_013670 [Portunus trituberculatus]|uniref:Uncharacterized protein n=1 Tax=Portunus trituberculatus TaxID=210409 RepID=A0A5B7DHT3_PORTR|nr:hypothetical protein [Portunus trituberculatus]
MVLKGIKLIDNTGTQNDEKRKKNTFNTHKPTNTNTRTMDSEK